MIKGINYQFLPLLNNLNANEREHYWREHVLFWMKKLDNLSQKIVESRMQVYHESKHLSQLCCPCGSEIPKELKKITLEMI